MCTKKSRLILQFCDTFYIKCSCNQINRNKLDVTVLNSQCLVTCNVMSGLLHYKLYLFYIRHANRPSCPRSVQHCNFKNNVPVLYIITHEYRQIESCYLRFKPEIREPILYIYIYIYIIKPNSVRIRFFKISLKILKAVNR